MAEEKLEQGWIRVRLTDSQNADLPCLKDRKGNLVKVYDYEGTELKFNTGARFVVWRGQQWRF